MCIRKQRTNQIDMIYIHVCILQKDHQVVQMNADQQFALKIAHYVKAYTFYDTTSQDGDLNVNCLCRSILLNFTIGQ